MRYRAASDEATIGIAIAGWLIPGAGHWLLGYRGLALVFFVAITVPFAFGLAIGGVKSSINPWLKHWVFAGAAGCGGYTAGALAANVLLMKELPARLVPDILAQDQSPVFRNMSADQQQALQKKIPQYVSFYPESDVAEIYLPTAGLLNFLAVIDAIARAKTGKPTYARELVEPGAPAASEAGGRPA